MSESPADAEAYKEKLRSLRFGRVPGGSRASTEQGVRQPPNASWERGVKGEHRVDGSFMPYVDRDMNPIRMKQWSENRHNYQAQLDTLRKPAEE